MRKTAALVARFVTDIKFGVIGFVVVGLAALGLHLSDFWIGAFNAVSCRIVTAVKVPEQGLFVPDGVGFAFLAILSSVNLCAEILMEFR